MLTILAAKRGSVNTDIIAKAAAHLTVEDILIDSMRGRSSTWTRIRVNTQTGNART